jgi:hypothetical protein
MGPTLSRAMKIILTGNIADFFDEEQVYRIFFVFEILVTARNMRGATQRYRAELLSSFIIVKIRR